MCPLQFKEPSAVIKACRDLASPNPSCCNSLNVYISDVQKQMLITNRQAINCATLFGSLLQKGGVMTNVYELCDVDLKDFSLQGMVATLNFSLLFAFFCAQHAHIASFLTCFPRCYAFSSSLNWSSLSAARFVRAHFLSFELMSIPFKSKRFFSLKICAHGIICLAAGCLLRSLPADVLYDNYTGYSFTCDLSDNIGAPWPSSSSLSSLSLCAPGILLGFFDLFFIDELKFENMLLLYVHLKRVSNP